jgi:hypothetical protein
MRRPSLRPLLPAVALLLATFVALRGDPVLVFFDILASLGLGAGALAAIGGHAVTRRLLPGLLGLVGSFAGSSAFSFARPSGRRALPPRSSIAALRSRSFPPASRRPGFSRPVSPYRTNFIV